jgi:uncharacterized protein with HEPN domain
MAKVKESSWLNDILNAISKIERHPRYAEGRAGYDADEYFRDVIQLNIERICEACKHLVDEYDYDEKYPDVPWRQITGMRIILAHVYWNIEDDIVWDIVERDLPELKKQTQEWLSKL